MKRARKFSSTHTDLPNVSKKQQEEQAKKNAKELEHPKPKSAMEPDPKLTGPLSEKEKENAAEKAPEVVEKKEVLEEAKERTMHELGVVDPAAISDHVRAELGIENRPVKTAEEDEEERRKLENAKK